MAEEKLRPKQAAIKAMHQVTGALIAIVLVLCAVFVPVAFLGGIAGQLYKQFAVTVAVSVVLFGIVALTLTPALCALLLKARRTENKLFAPFNRMFERLTGGLLPAPSVSRSSTARRRPGFRRRDRRHGRPLSYRPGQLRAEQKTRVT